MLILTVDFRFEWSTFSALHQPGNPIELIIGFKLPGAAECGQFQMETQVNPTRKPTMTSRPSVRAYGNECMDSVQTVENSAWRTLECAATNGSF